MSTSRPRLTRALVLADEDDAAGFLGERADSHGVELVSVQRARDGYPPALTGYDLVISLGSDWSVTAAESTPWIAREIDLLRAAITDDLPVLGVCFGAQVLAAALGAAVRTAAAPEFGWIEIQSLDEGLIPPGPWFAWHHDVVDLPRGARLLARNASGVQAYRYGRSVGVQFHPEVTAAIIEGWVRELAHQLASAGVDAGELLAASAGQLDSARRNAHKLFDSFVGLARLSGSGQTADHASTAVMDHSE